MTRILVAAFILFPLVTIADDDRAQLFDAANEGDIQAIEQLEFSYARWSSLYFDEDRALYWRCTAGLAGSERAILELQSLGDWRQRCGAIIEKGNSSRFHIYVASGELIRSFDAADFAAWPTRVPSGTIWKLNWQSEACPKVCTADLRVKGVAYLGQDKELLVDGEVELTSNAANSVLWVMPGSEVYVLRSNETMVLNEYGL